MTPTYNRGRRVHRWRVWNSLGSSLPFTERCHYCRLKRRIKMVRGPYDRSRGRNYVQLYQWPGQSDWIRGRDGSVLFDHGGIPACPGAPR